MIYLGNAFSLQMLDMTDAEYKDICVKKVGDLEIKAILGGANGKTVHSVIGHQDLANILGVPYNRESVTLKKGDRLYVAQVIGGRLPEGTTVLPEGFKLTYLRVDVND